MPHLLGFVPQASLVVIGTEPPHDRIKVTLRYDLPDPPGAGVAADIAAHAVGVVGSQRLTAMVAVGYGPEAAGRLRSRARCVTRRGQARIELRDVLRVEDGRYWSYACGDEACCPAAGTPFDPAAHPAAAAHGQRRERRCWPTGPRWRRRSRRSAASPPNPCARPPAGPNGTPPSCSAKVRKSARIGAVRQMMPTEGLDAVGAMIATYRAGGKYTTDYQIAWITVALRDLRVRDDA